MNVPLCEPSGLVPRKKNSAATRKSRRADIERISAALGDEALRVLHEFAEYLETKYPSEEPALLEVVSIPRPEEESVVAAIKRLAKTYPMLEKTRLFEQTSTVMSAHILNDVSARESIDRLEEVFAAEYALLAGADTSPEDPAS